MSQAPTAAPIADVVDGYFAMWNETDPAARRAAIAATWSPDARYRDPLFAAAGHDALDAMVVAVHEHYPGCRFRPAGDPDAHHDRARWGWEFVGPDGAAIVASGVDFAALAPDGRLLDVTGFFAPHAAA